MAPSVRPDSLGFVSFTSGPQLRPPHLGAGGPWPGSGHTGGPRAGVPHLRSCRRLTLGHALGHTCASQQCGVMRSGRFLSSVYCFVYVCWEGWGCNGCVCIWDEWYVCFYFENELQESNIRYHIHPKIKKKTIIYLPPRERHIHSALLSHPTPVSVRLRTTIHRNTFIAPSL